MTLIYEPTMFTGRHTGQGGYASHNLPPNITYPTAQCPDYSYGEQLPQGPWMYPAGPGRGHPEDPWSMLQSGGFGATGHHHHQGAYTRSPPVNPPDFVRGHGAIVPNPAASGSSSTTGSLPMPTHTATDSGNRSLRGGPPYDWIKKSPNPDDLGQHQGYKPGKTRTRDKYRVVYSDHQRLELEKEFHYSKYITIRRKSELAQALQLSERQVKIWFQNRRAKERKMSKKKDDIISKQTVDLHSHQVTHASAIAAPTIVHGQHPLHG